MSSQLWYIRANALAECVDAERIWVIRTSELLRFADSLRTQIGLNKILDYPRMQEAFVQFVPVTRLRLWTVCGRGLFPDFARLFRECLPDIA